MLMTGTPLASLKGKPRSDEMKLSQVGGPPPLPRMKPRDANVVLQLLEEIHQLVTPGQVLATESPRLSAAAKLYLDTRDTFEVIEQKVEEHLLERPKVLRKLSKRSSITKKSTKADLSTSLTPATSPDSISQAPSVASVVTEDEPNDGVIDRIQEMFRHLGEQLGPAILKELKHRKLTIQSILHYVRFLSADCQWTAYKDTRKEQVALAYRAPSPSQQQQQQATSSEIHMLKHHAEFIKEHIRKDVDTVCLFSADGTLSTIFGDDIKADKEFVADKFESLVIDVYSSYLRSIIDAQMDRLIHLSNHWQQQMAASRTVEPPFVQYFSRIRKFRTKVNIFPKTMFTLEDRLAGLPQPASGQTLKILIADLRDLGIWWQKSVLSMTERDVSTIHTDEARNISGRVESLDGQIYLPILTDNNNNDVSRRFWKSGVLAKWIGQSLLVNNGKDSIWVEVVVKDVEDKKCKLELKKSLEGCIEASNWKRVLAPNEWHTIRDFKFMVVPLNPNFRFHMGQKFRDVLNIIQSVVVEISSIFPNDELNRKVGNALWRSVESSVSKGEHIYARYLRSTLNQEVLPRRILPSRATRERSSSIISTSSVRNLVAAFENSTLGSVSGALSAPSPSSPTTSALGESRNSVIADKPVPGHFDDQGRYHYQPVSRIAPNTAVRGATMSPFEKLSHHLLEETEIVGICIQANNAAVGRAFVQVLHEKISKVLRNLETKFENEQTSTIEVVLAEYANTCRFLYVWRICRHELDTIPRQARGRTDASNMHTEWVDRTFERMDKLIIEMIHQQLHFAHRVFFHECSSYFLPGIYEQTWQANKPWFGNSRCTYGVQFFIMRLHDLLEYMLSKLLPQYERTLAVHDKLYDLAVWMLLDIMPCLAASYETLVVSRARTLQWKIDVLYLVYGVHKFLRLLNRMLIPRITMSDDKGKRKLTCEVRIICLRLLACAAIRVGPADIVLDAVAKKIETENFDLEVDATTELEFHINSIVTSLSPKSSGGTAISGRDEEPDEVAGWNAHSVFGAMELRKLGDVSLSWAALISRCSFPREDLIKALSKRHELGDWAFPVLSESEQKMRDQLQQFLQKVNSDEAHEKSEYSRADDEDEEERLRSENSSSALNFERETEQIAQQLGDHEDHYLDSDATEQLGCEDRLDLNAAEQGQASPDDRPLGSINEQVVHEALEEAKDEKERGPRVPTLVAVGNAQWTQLWDYDSGGQLEQPEKRAAHAMITFQDTLFIYGGIGEGSGGSDKEFEDTWRFDLLAQNWTKVVGDADLKPPHRFHHTGVLHSNSTVNELVIFGGLSISSNDSTGIINNNNLDDQLAIVQYNDVWRLQLSSTSNSLEWTKDPVSTDLEASFPSARSEAGAVIYQNLMLVFGGILYDNNVEKAPMDNNELWSYDLSSCLWTKVAPLGTARPSHRFSHSVSLMNDGSGASYLVVFSGRRLEYSTWTLLDDTWLYAIEQNQWVPVTSASTIARAYTSLVSINAMDMWFFGGYYKPKQGPNGYVYDDVVMGKFALNKLHSDSTTTTTTTTTTNNNNVITTNVNMLTPQSLATPTPPVISASVKMYYGLTSTQTASPPLRYNHRASAWQSCMVVHGGSYQTQRGDVWIYNTTTARLREESAAALPMDIETLVYVLGGFIVSIITILMILLVRWRRVDRQHMEAARRRGESAPRGVSQERLDQLEITKYKRPSKEKDVGAPSAPPINGDEQSMNEDLCPICLIEFEDDEDVRNLPCRHFFHVSCIDEWFRRNTSCPMCKSNVDLDAVNINVEPPSPAAVIPRAGAVVTPVPDT